MVEAQRQGRLSFYMVSAGEEAITVGAAAALGPDDVITCQYRETGVFQQRGFTLKDFMSQLTSNKNDPGKGRNMPCHYSGKVITGVVSRAIFYLYSIVYRLTRVCLTACRCINSGNSDPTCHRCSIRLEDGSDREPYLRPSSSRLLFR